MDVTNIISLAVGLPGAAAMGLLIWDRVRDKHKDAALTHRDLTDFKTQLDVAVQQNTAVAADAKESLLDRLKLNMRVGTLEQEVKRFDETRDAVIAMRERNTVEHQTTMASIGRLENAVTGLQSQIRAVTIGGANAALTITRTSGVAE